MKREFFKYTSAFYEIPNDHTGNTPHIPTDGEREAAIDESGVALMSSRLLLQTSVAAIGHGRGIPGGCRGERWSVTQLA